MQMVKIVRFIQLNGSYSFIWAQVPDDMYEKLLAYNWWGLNDDYTIYVRGRPKGSSRKISLIYMHRLIMGLEVGDPRQVDHKNGVGWHNDRFNLRICTRSQNRIHSRKQRSFFNFRGVYKDQSYISRPYQAMFRGKSLGYFSTKKEAAQVYDVAVLKYAPEFAVLNFPNKRDSYLKIIEGGGLVL